MVALPKRTRATPGASVVTTGAAGGSGTLEQPNSDVVAPAAPAARKERRVSDMAGISERAAG